MNTNTNNLIDRKKMIKYMIETNKIYNSENITSYDIIIDKMFKNYNNYAKKVIHNIISNILNKKNIDQNEIIIMENIITKIFEGVKFEKLKLTYYDTLMFIIDKIFLFGKLTSSDNKKRIDMIKFIQKKINNYNNKTSIDIIYIKNYINLYEINFNREESKIETSENFTSNNEHKNKLTLKDFKKDSIFSIKKETITGGNKKSFVNDLSKNYDFNSTIILSKINSIDNFTVQVIGYYTSINYNKFIVFFEINIKVIFQYPITDLKKLIEKREIQKNSSEINKNNLFTISKFGNLKKSIVELKDGKLFIRGQELYNNSNNN